MDPVSIVDIMTTGLNAVKSDFMSMVAIAVPIGLAIFGVGFGIRKAKKMVNAAS